MEELVRINYGAMQKLSVSFFLLMVIQSLAGLIEDHRTCMLSQTYLLSDVSLCTVTLFVSY
jgi:hypothetical protein